MSKITNNLEQVIEGMKLASETITSTMGPKGKLVAIYEDNKIKFTKDGVTVAKSIELPDPLQNIGAKILISAANQTVAQCGDGTTATSLLTTKFIEHFYKTLVESTDTNKKLKELDEEVEQIVSKLESASQTLTTPEEIKDITTISSNSEKIGDIFYEIYSEVGLDSLIYLERPSGALNTHYEVSKGAEFNSGFVHSAFINDKVNSSVVFEDVYLHITADPVTQVTKEISDLLGAAMNHNKAIVIVAPRFSDTFIRTAVMNKTQQNLQVCLVKTPGYGEGISKNQNDLKAYLSEANTIDKVVITTHTMTLFNEDTPHLTKHIEHLKNLANTAIEPYAKKDYLRRAHELGRTAATIFAGGVTPEAAFEEYDRLEDAVGAARTAVNSGFLPGGGLALLQAGISTPLDHITNAPYIKILRNANEKVRYSPSLNHGINFKTGEFTDYVANGIIDPTDVVINSFKNAYESFRLIFNTSYIVDNN